MSNFTLPVPDAMLVEQEAATWLGVIVYGVPTAPGIPNVTAAKQPVIGYISLYNATNVTAPGWFAAPVSNVLYPQYCSAAPEAMGTPFLHPGQRYLYVGPLYANPACAPYTVRIFDLVNPAAPALVRHTTTCAPDPACVLLPVQSRTPGECASRAGRLRLVGFGFVVMR